MGKEDKEVIRIEKVRCPVLARAYAKQVGTNPQGLDVFVKFSDNQPNGVMCSEYQGSGCLQRASSPSRECVYSKWSQF